MGTRTLPAGTVTLLFTDVEGSTKLLHALGAVAYAEALAEHRRILRNAFTAHGGVEVDTQGDAFFVAFPAAPGALAAAAEARHALATGPIRVRMALHTGSPLLTDEGYVGDDVHRAARIAAAGHGGQILVSSATAAVLPNTGVRDLGVHRLKDLSTPERIYQFGDDEHSPLRTLHQTNLPVPATPFLGREEELSEIRVLLVDSTHRLITLTGPGGTGKTRLALQSAASAADAFPGGVWWVPLAPLRDPALVLESATKALGAAGDLAEHIGDDHLLLLLDNFEHVSAAARDVASLLRRCPNLTVLVTSREPLHLGGEHQFAVDGLQPAEAIELFLTRAASVKRDFSAGDEVARICEWLDHLPLAIELAAARVKVLSPAVLLERLEQRLPLLAGGAPDLPERQRTLRATIEWSHDLLASDEQRLFARLPVFRGGCTLAAAEAVADADIDTLQSLVDKSLLRAGDDRFWMLETIREFALGRLEDSGGADDLRRRHAAHFLALAEEAEPHVFHDDQAWLDRLAADNDNLRAAFDHLEAIGDHGRTATLAGGLWRFWYQKSHFAEGLRRLEAALEHGVEEPDVRARILRGAAVMSLNLGDIPGGRAYAEQALSLEHELGDPWGIAFVSILLSGAMAEARDESRDLAGARRHGEDALRRFEEIGDVSYALVALSNLAWYTYEIGDRGTAQSLYERALASARSLGNAGIEAESTAQLGLLACDDGQVTDGARLLREAVRIDHHRGSTDRTAAQLGRLASVLARLGDAERAATLATFESAAVARLGIDLSWKATDRRDGTLALVAKRLDQDALDAAIARGRVLNLDEAVALALRDPSAPNSTPRA